MAAWKLLHIGFEGDEVMVGGRDVWKSHWNRTDEGSITVPHPSYPQQSHSMSIYSLDTPTGVHFFAAGEFSNQVWGIYIQKDE